MSTTVKTLDGMQTLPIVKQVALLIGLAASIAMAVYVVLWAQGTDYIPLGGNYSDKQAAEVVDVLTRGGINHRIDARTGLVVVDSTQLSRAKMQLAKEGVSNQGGVGLELLDKENGLTTSQFIERTRYIRGLQGELERTITQIKQVKKARVHLAIPKQSSFIRDKKPPSASVFVDIVGGVQLNANQVAAIINLVSTSVQGLTPDKVTVIDQFGALLSSQSQGELALATEQLTYKQKLEDMYSHRINDLLAPLVGDGRVRAKVTANIDYTGREKTYESFDPDKSAVRSEQTLDVSKSGGDIAGGIPGALSNIPPGTATVPEQATTRSEDGEEATATPVAQNVRKQATRNYEVDRTIGHERKLPGQLLRLSVAVVVDHKATFSSSGKVTKEPFTEQEVEQMTQLVKDAIGFDQERGDTVTVINSPFAQTQPIEELPPIPMYEQPWFMSVVKQSLAGLFVLIVLFTVVRPFMKNMTNISQIQKEHNQRVLELTQQNESIAKHSDNMDEMTRVRSLIKEDPKRVAQVVKTMVKVDNE